MSIDSGDTKGKASVEMSVDPIVEEFVTPPSSPPQRPPPDPSNGWRGKITGVMGKITGIFGFGGWKSSQMCVEPQLHDVNTQCTQSSVDKTYQAPDAAELNTKKRKNKRLTCKSNTKFSPPRKKLKNSESSTDEVLNDNQHSSMLYIPVTSREELVNGQKVKDPWLMSKCSLSLDEERDQRDKAIEDENVNCVDECVGKELFQSGIRTEYTELMLFKNTADIANVVNTVGQMERPYTKRFDTEVQSFCSILGKEEVAQDSFAMIAPSEQTAVIAEKCLDSSIIHLQCSRQTHFAPGPSGVSVDNQHCMTNIPFASREESLNGKKFQNIWHISRCSMSGDAEESNRGPCGKATEDENVKQQSLFGNCVDEEKPFQGIDEDHIQAGLALIQKTADMANVLNIVEQVEILCPKMFDAEVQPTCNNLSKEVAQDAGFIIAPSEQAMHATTNEEKEIGDSSIVHSHCSQQTHSVQDSSGSVQISHSEQMEIPFPKRFDAEVQPTCNNLSKEVAQDAFFIISPSEQAMHATIIEEKECADSSIVHSHCSQQTHYVQDSSGFPLDKQLNLADPFSEASTEGPEMLHSLPDFLLVGQKGEFLHEGLAKGDMQIFVNVEDKTSKAQLDEPKFNQEKPMIALTDVKANGHALRPLPNRAQDIRRAKDNQVQIDGELGQVDKEVIREQNKDVLLKSAADTEDEKIQSLDESLTETKQQLILLSFEEQTKASSIAQLQKKIQQTREDLKNIKLEFERVATAPW